jgi:DNA-binding response OmpR family regulator
MRPKILIIDGDIYLQYLLKIQLQRLDYQVVMATSGREGLQAADRVHPDLVVVDFFLLDMGGWEIGQRLRERSDVPILMLAPYSLEEKDVKRLMNCANDCLNKPFSTLELVVRIETLLSRAGDLNKATVHDNGRSTVQDCVLG